MYEIVEIGPDRIDEVHEVWAGAGLEFRPDGRDSVDHLSAEIADGTAVVLGAIDGDALIAVAIVTDDGRKGWINRLAVAPDHRRSGLGRDLLGACEEILRERGIGIAAALVFDDNLPSRAMFESSGYARPPVAYYRKALDDTES